MSVPALKCLGTCHYHILVHVHDRDEDLPRSCVQDLYF